MEKLTGNDIFLYRNISKRKTIQLTFTSLIIIVFLLFLLSTRFTSGVKKTRVKTQTVLILKKRKHAPTKLMLFYTGFFGQRPWNVDRNLWVVIDNTTEHCGCHFEGCRFTYNISEFSDSDAVIFHALDMPGKEHLMQLNKKRKQGQLWIYFCLESPMIHALVDDYDTFFNLSATYRPSSDIFTPYRYHYKRKIPLPASNINYAANKTRIVAYVQTHCNLMRDKLARRLIEHGVEIDVGGGCSRFYRNLTKSLYCHDWPCSKTLSRYRFYFAAENAICKDYITEKYWKNGILNNAIPIVFGGGNYEDPVLAIPGSYINSFKFRTVKDLANHIKELATDDAKFNKYFEWKRLYTFPEEKKGCDQFMCNVCQKMHSNITTTKKPLSSNIKRSECGGEKETQFDKWVLT